MLRKFSFLMVAVIFAFYPTAAFASSIDDEVNDQEADQTSVETASDEQSQAEDEETTEDASDADNPDKEEAEKKSEESSSEDNETSDEENNNNSESAASDQQSEENNSEDQDSKVDSEEADVKEEEESQEEEATPSEDSVETTEAPKAESEEVDQAENDDSEHNVQTMVVDQVAGSLEASETHFSVGDDHYITEVDVHVENNSNEPAEDVRLVLETPENAKIFNSNGVNPHTIFSDDADATVKLGTIGAGDAVDESFELHVRGKNMGHNTNVIAYAANKDENNEVQKLADVGVIDISAAKGYDSEVEANVQGTVVQDDQGNNVLETTITGKNNSIYGFDQSDDIYLTFDLPYDVELDTERASEDVIDPSGVKEIAIHIDADAESSFEKTVDIPLKGEHRTSDYNRNLSLQHYSGGSLSLSNGNVSGQTHLDFSAMGGEDKGDDQGDEVDLSGSISGDTHFDITAGDLEGGQYILDSSITINNDSDETAKNVTVKLTPPDKVNIFGYDIDGDYEYGEEIELGDINPNESKTVKPQIHLTGTTDEKTKLNASVYQDGEEDESEALDSSAGLDVMKDEDAEVDAEVTGEVVQTDDEYDLKVSVSGENQSPYHFQTEDNVYLYFPIHIGNVEVDTDRLEGTDVLAFGDSGIQAGVHLKPDENQQFEGEFTIPLVGKPGHTVESPLEDLIKIGQRYEFEDSYSIVSGASTLQKTSLDYSVYNEDQDKISSEEAQKIATTEFGGNVVSVEEVLAKGKEVYAVELENSNDGHINAYVTVYTGEIAGTDKIDDGNNGNDSDNDDNGNDEKGISEEDAKDIATNKYNGDVVNVEKTDMDGAETYAVELKNSDNGHIKAYVDAASGEIVATEEMKEVSPGKGEGEDPSKNGDDNGKEETTNGGHSDNGDGDVSDNEDNNGKDNKEGGKLPVTDSGLPLGMLIGTLIAVVGGGLYVFRNKLTALFR